VVSGEDETRGRREGEVDGGPQVKIGLMNGSGRDYSHVNRGTDI